RARDRVLATATRRGDRTGRPRDGRGARGRDPSRARSARGAPPARGGPGPATGLLAPLPSIAGPAAGLWGYVWLRGRAGLPPIVDRTAIAAEPPMPAGLDRRRLLVGGAGVREVAPCARDASPR